MRNVLKAKLAVGDARAQRALRAATGPAAAAREVRRDFGGAEQQRDRAVDVLGLRAVGGFDDAFDRARQHRDVEIERALRNDDDRLLVQCSRATSSAHAQHVGALLHFIDREATLCVDARIHAVANADAAHSTAASATAHRARHGAVAAVRLVFECDRETVRGRAVLQHGAAHETGLRRHQRHVERRCFAVLDRDVRDHLAALILRHQVAHRAAEERAHRVVTGLQVVEHIGAVR